jgi:hypothetical protein
MTAGLDGLVSAGKQLMGAASNDDGHARMLQDRTTQGPRSANLRVGELVKDLNREPLGAKHVT